MKGIVSLYEDQADFGFSQIKAVLSDKTTVVLEGDFKGVSNGELIEFSAAFVTGDCDGRPLYEVASFRVVDPENMNELMLFLGGGLFPKLGEARAKHIIEKDGLTPENYAELLPLALEGMRGVSTSDKARILKQLEIHLAALKTDEFLSEHGIRTIGAMLVNEFGSSVLDMIKHNPFVLGTKHDIGFNDCLHLARIMIRETDCSFEFGDIILCALACYVRKFMGGSTWILKEKVLSAVSSYLNTMSDIATPPEGWTIESSLEDAITEGLLVVDDGRMYFPSYYRAEKMIAERLVPLVIQPVKEIPFYPQKKTKLCDEQINAIRTMLSHNFTIMTGGPGTGKTTTVGCVIKPLEDAGFRVGLAAPTGKAAIRLYGSTGRPAMTVHRLLGVGLKDPEDAPIKLYDTIIIDEASMLDTELLCMLVERLEAGSRLILVGDFDQLPSVGPGNVLRDLIESDCIPVCELVENHRQSKVNGGLAKCIDDMRDGVVQDKTLYLGSDMMLVPACGPEAIMEKTIETVKGLSRSRGMREVKVLSPYRREDLDCSCEQLNPMLRDAWGVEGGGSGFLPGDIVMETHNDKAKSLFNGEMGIVLSVDEGSGSARIVFGEKNDRRFYNLSKYELASVILAYAMTVHKSQGSEYRVIVLALVPGSSMLTRRLLYTAISRAQDLLILVGDWSTFVGAVNTFEIRNTTLAERIREAFGLDPVRMPFISHRPAVQLELAFNAENPWSMQE